MAKATLEIKEVPESFLALRRELLHHPDIFKAANEGKNIEQCLGIIAAKLGIVLDGYYDVPELCDVLVTALFRRGTINVDGGKDATLSDPRLRPVQMVETDTEIRFEEKGLILPPGITKVDVDTAVQREVLKDIAPNDIDEKILAGGFAEEDAELTVTDASEIFTDTPKTTTH